MTATDPTTHDFLPVAGHPGDDECTYRSDGTDATYCGRQKAEHTEAATDPAESDDLLENYRLGTHQPESGKRPVIVAICTRPHREGGAWVGICARDLDGGQTDLTLAELVEQAEQHEVEQHMIEEPS